MFVHFEEPSVVQPFGAGNIRTLYMFLVPVISQVFDPLTKTGSTANMSAAGQGTWRLVKGHDFIHSAHAAA